MFKLAALLCVVGVAATAPVISLDLGSISSLHKEKHAMAKGTNQDWVERCPAKVAAKNCPFPVARAFDSHDKQVKVTTAIYLMDLENKAQGKNGKLVNRVDFSKRSTYLFKYDAKDEANNKAEQVVFVLELNDLTPPELTVCGQPIDYAEGARPYSVCNSRATDNMAVSSISYTMKRVGGSTVFRGDHAGLNKKVRSLVYNPAGLGKYVIYMTVNDKAGIYGKNSMSNTVTKTKGLVIRDTKSPWIVMTGRSNVRVECGSSKYTDAGATLRDHYWPAPWNKKAATTTENNVNVKKIGSYTVRFNGKDVAGNKAMEATRLVHVDDTKNPTIKVNGAAVEQHWSQDKFTDKGVTTSDDCDKNLPKYTTWWSGASGSFDQKQLGKHYLNYKVCDHVGRCSTTKRTIVVEDNKKPKLNLVGDSKMTLQAKHGAKYNDRGAQCQDFVDGNLRHAITNVIALNGKTVTSVSMAQVGTYTITYSCKDASGNAADTIKRTVVVRDTTCPTLALKGKGLISLEAGVSSYTDAGASAKDNMDGDISAQVKTVGSVNTKKPGTYILQYTVKDSSNNAQCKKVSRKVVVKDTLPPVIKLQLSKGYQMSKSGQKGLDGQVNKPW